MDGEDEKEKLEKLVTLFESIPGLFPVLVKTLQDDLLKSGFVNADGVFVGKDAAPTKVIETRSEEEIKRSISNVLRIKRQ